MTSVVIHTIVTRTNMESTIGTISIMINYNIYIYIYIYIYV
jgi:hypothetical protein